MNGGRLSSITGHQCICADMVVNNRLSVEEMKFSVIAYLNAAGTIGSTLDALARQCRGGVNERHIGYSERLA